MNYGGEGGWGWGVRGIFMGAILLSLKIIIFKAQVGRYKVQSSQRSKKKLYAFPYCRKRERR